MTPAAKQTPSMQKPDPGALTQLNHPFYVFSYLSRFRAKSMPAQVKAVKRVFYYLNGTRGLEFVHRKELKLLTSPTNVDCAEDLESRRKPLQAWRVAGLLIGYIMNLSFTTEIANKSGSNKTCYLMNKHDIITIPIPSVDYPGFTSGCLHLLLDLTTA
ncbi:hypothetical protein GQ43DRAFT_435178 [Delitschia confertaspora ATCC 74209]|uniref:Uncharacterized protein n=1 Tax=Delitschia confertaspora ATCC 74209 TaxID=1513339 RepID=A0A9P4MLR3_9PLEO|nr:hypothetical protein GQ43DRAFT_435178 [Delitschia confertaspora ATCC 74209]